MHFFPFINNIQEGDVNINYILYLEVFFESFWGFQLFFSKAFFFSYGCCRLLNKYARCLNRSTAPSSHRINFLSSPLRVHASSLSNIVWLDKLERYNRQINKMARGVAKQDANDDAVCNILRLL